jgi:hexosaminidase
VNAEIDIYNSQSSGQHLLWSEQSGPSNLDSIVWPRAASSAEVYFPFLCVTAPVFIAVQVFWSGPGGNSDKALPRLHDASFRFVQRGIKAIPLQPLWCALRPGACDLTA